MKHFTANKTIVKSEISKKGILSFYAHIGNEKLYLFSQPYRVSVKMYYKNGVGLNQAIDYSRAQHNTALLHTMYKLRMYIRFVEREYGIVVFDKTAKVMKKKCA